MLQQIAPAFRVTLLLTILTGLIYPLGVTGICQVVFPHQANGSLIEANGKILGSELIGQSFTQPEYLQSRPSSAGSGYDGAASGGSNFGPTNQKLIERVKGDVAKFRKANPAVTGPIPADLLTASGSGLDPHVSPAAADVQIHRIALARGVLAAQVREAVLANTESRTLGFLGEPRVNVLRANLELDRRFGRR